MFYTSVCSISSLAVPRNVIKFHSFLRKRHNTNPVRGPFHFRAPSRIVWRVIRGMIPHKTARGQAALNRLKVFEGIPEPYDKMQKMVMPDALRVTRLKAARKYTVLGEMASKVGWKHAELVDVRDNSDASEWLHPLRVVSTVLPPSESSVAVASLLMQQQPLVYSEQGCACLRPAHAICCCCCCSSCCSLMSCCLDIMSRGGGGQHCCRLYLFTIAWLHAMRMISTLRNHTQMRHCPYTAPGGEAQDHVRGLLRREEGEGTPGGCCQGSGGLNLPFASQHLWLALGGGFALLRASMEMTYMDFQGDSARASLFA